MPEPEMRMPEPEKATQNGKCQNKKKQILRLREG